MRHFAASAPSNHIAYIYVLVYSLTDLDRLYATIKAEKGALDIIVANAAFVEVVPTALVTPEHFDKTFNINARGTFFTVQKGLPLLRNGGVC